MEEVIKATLGLIMTCAVLAYFLTALFAPFGIVYLVFFNQEVYYVIGNFDWHRCIFSISICCTSVYLIIFKSGVYDEEAV